MLVLSGCLPAAGVQPAGKKLRIVTTVGMVSDLVQQVAGEHAEVVGLMGAGVDPHLYKPTRDAASLLSGAQIVVASGLHLEGRMQETLDQLAKSGKPVLVVTDVLREKHADKLRKLGDQPDQFDPHVWMDAGLWKECAGGLAEQLAKVDPDHAADFRANAAKYQAELTALDKYAREAIATIPEERRYLLTAHDAFEYFSRAYSIPVRSVQGVSTDSEAGLADQNALVQFIVEHKIPAVFIESSVPPKSVQAVLEGAAAKGSNVQPGGELFSDAMGAEGTYEGTYLGMIDHNVTTIVRALGGKASEGGRLGKLAAAGHAKPDAEKAEKK